ncbi:Transcription factor, fungi [Penicillium italicum]|uniref:Transcription factor, fungi n=1 Tax=Penicillium italicum TaxID=40296 RepID=A0A0A2L780_PENIT|nr:Transcription factor, fungi [Penicillium italicum]
MINPQNSLNMIDRLETNIQRMEAYFQKIGFDLDEDVNGSSFFEGLERSDESSSSSPAENTDLLQHAGIWNSEPIHLDAEQDPSAATQDVDVYHTLVNPASDEADPDIPKDLPCFYVPRCFTDTPNSGFSALSSEGTKWITHKMEGASVDNLQSFLSLGSHQGSNRSPLEGTFPDKPFSPLPPKDEMLSLVNDYLQHFNSLIPIFQPSSLLSLCEDGNLQGTLNIPGRWASLNAVLAIGYLLRIKNSSLVQTDRQKSWMFMKNALGILNELCFGLPDLWTVQALIGMIFFLLGTLSSQPCGYLISSALRIIHQIRLERCENGSGLCPEELEQRRRIFWIAYCLDKEISIRAGIPLAQRDDDMDVLLPMEVPLDNIGTMSTTDRQGTFNAFRSMCELALIRSQIYKQLYSVAAADRPLVEVAAAVAMLNQKLQQWKDSIPTEFQPEPRRSSVLPKSTTLLFLHLSYFNCLIATHWVTAARGSRLGMDLVERNSVYNAPHPVVFMSESLCIKAATASINLMKYMPNFNIALIGIMIYYPILASKTLSSTIVQNPRGTSRIYHIKLIMQVETFVSSLVFDTPNDGIDGLLRDCAEYRSLAEAAVREATQICRG